MWVCHIALSILDEIDRLHNAFIKHFNEIIIDRICSIFSYGYLETISIQFLYDLYEFKIYLVPHCLEISNYLFYNLKSQYITKFSLFKLKISIHHYLICMSMPQDHEDYVHALLIQKRQKIFCVGYFI